MFYVIPAEASFTDIFTTKGFDHYGRFARRDDACRQADALHEDYGNQYSVIELRVVHTTQTIDEALKATA